MGDFLTPDQICELSRGEVNEGYTPEVQKLVDQIVRGEIDRPFTCAYCGDKTNQPPFVDIPSYCSKSECITQVCP